MGEWGRTDRGVARSGRGPASPDAWVASHGQVRSAKHARVIGCRGGGRSSRDEWVGAAGGERLLERSPARARGAVDRARRRSIAANQPRVAHASPVERPTASPPEHDQWIDRSGSCGVRCRRALGHLGIERPRCCGRARAGPARRASPVDEPEPRSGPCRSSSPGRSCIVQLRPEDSVRDLLPCLARWRFVSAAVGRRARKPRSLAAEGVARVRRLRRSAAASSTWSCGPARVRGAAPTRVHSCHTVPSEVLAEGRFRGGLASFSICARSRGRAQGPCNNKCCSGSVSTGS